MHWECVPDSERSEVESARTYRHGFRPGNDSDHSSVTDDLR